MAVLKTVETKIQTVEKFKVVFMQDGINVRGDRRDIPTYPYSSAAPGSWTVAEWIAKRFKPRFPNFDAKVTTNLNVLVTGNSKLENT